MVAQLTCVECGVAIHAKSKTGRCRVHALAVINSDPEISARRAAARDAFNATRKKAPRVCSDCPTPISRGSKGRCRRCTNLILNADPERHAKAAASYRKRYRSDPAFREAVTQRNREGVARAMANNPRFVEARRENGRKAGRLNIHHSWTPEVRARAGRTNSARRLAHIPADYRDLYRDLIKQDLSAAERTRIVLEHAEADRLRAARTVQQSEQQMRERHERQQREAY